VVYIQTFNPEHYSISALARHNEADFYQKELMSRQAGDFPPFTNLIRLVFSGSEKKAVIQAATEVTTEIKKVFSISQASPYAEGERTVIIGPNPAAIERVQDRYRWQTLIKTKDLAIFYGLLPDTVFALRRKNHGNVRIIIDENPFSML
jgi:primosomal protein N' (replication factor Y)